MSVPLQMASAIFLLAARLIKQPEGKGWPKRPSGLPKMPANSPENIRKFIRDFTAPFGEIPPTTLSLQTRSVGV